VLHLLFGKSKKGQLSLTQLLQSIDFASVSAGRCVYAIGDIHGMSELCEKLLKTIAQDIALHGLRSDVIVLGDMVDRGPDSRAVMEFILQAKQKSSANIQYTILKGNHEQMMLDFLAEPEQNGPFWLKNGGKATLQSYGVHPPENINRKQWNFVRDEFLARMPPHHLSTFKNLPSKLTIDDYFFCHASIKEGQGLGEQNDEDLLWSRRFPKDGWGPQEKIIVHGHQPVAEPLVETFHINVDTGAYASGRLSCVKLCGAERIFINASSSAAKPVERKQSEFIHD
jgi:serine/threonine protein phosphatase 1